MHSLHEPQKIDVQAITWSPGSTELTDDPTASTMPAGSCPGIVGSGPAIEPCMKCRSLWHTPQATVRTRTSFGRRIVDVDVFDAQFATDLAETVQLVLSSCTPRVLGRVGRPGRSGPRRGP